MFYHKMLSYLHTDDAVDNFALLNLTNFIFMNSVTLEIEFSLAYKCIYCILQMTYSLK